MAVPVSEKKIDGAGPASDPHGIGDAQMGQGRSQEILRAAQRLYAKRSGPQRSEIEELNRCLLDAAKREPERLVSMLLAVVECGKEVDKGFLGWNLTALTELVRDGYSVPLQSAWDAAYGCSPSEQRSALMESIARRESSYVATIARLIESPRISDAMLGHELAKGVADLPEASCLIQTIFNLAQGRERPSKEVKDLLRTEGDAGATEVAELGETLQALIPHHAREARKAISDALFGCRLAPLQVALHGLREGWPAEVEGRETLCSLVRDVVLHRERIVREDAKAAPAIIASALNALWALGETNERLIDLSLSHREVFPPDEPSYLVQKCRSNALVEALIREINEGVARHDWDKQRCMIGTLTDLVAVHAQQPELLSDKLAAVQDALDDLISWPDEEVREVALHAAFSLFRTPSEKVLSTAQAEIERSVTTKRSVLESDDAAVVFSGGEGFDPVSVIAPRRSEVSLVALLTRVNAHRGITMARFLWHHAKDKYPPSSTVEEGESYVPDGRPINRSVEELVPLFALVRANPNVRHAQVIAREASTHPNASVRAEWEKSARGGDTTS